MKNQEALSAKEFADFVTKKIAKFAHFAEDNSDLAKIDLYMADWLEQFAEWLEAGGPDAKD